MSLFQIYKMELYKMSKRKSSIILLIPSMLAVLIAFGMKSGFVQMNAAGRTAAVSISCMDYTSLIFSMMADLDIIGILIIIIAAFELSGEIERGQIKIELLRIGRRSKIILCKYLAVITAVICAVAIFTVIVMCTYYLLVSNSKYGNGIFSSTIKGVTDTAIFMSITCKMVDYFFIISIAYLTGIFFSPFITFVITLIMMYAENYMANITSFKFMHYMPSYMSSQIMSGKQFTDGHMTAFAACAILLISVIIGLTMMIFKRQDIK